MTRPKVFITQEVTTANYTTAEQFGDVVFLVATELSHVRGSLHNKRVAAVIRSKLSAFRPDVDYIAPSGSPIITGMAFAILREKASSFNVLKWNSRDSQYVALHIDLEGDVDV